MCLSCSNSKSVKSERSKRYFKFSTGMPSLGWDVAQLQSSFAKNKWEKTKPPRPTRLQLIAVVHRTVDTLPHQSYTLAFPLSVGARPTTKFWEKSIKKKSPFLPTFVCLNFKGGQGKTWFYHGDIIRKNYRQPRIYTAWVIFWNIAGFMSWWLASLH